MLGTLLFLLLLLSASSNEVLLNNTIYLTNGESFRLYQGYILGVKSVSRDNSVWLQLSLNNLIVKSEVLKVNDYFVHNKSNITILSVRLNNVYSGSSGQKLVSMSVHQFTDPELPLLGITEVVLQDNLSQNDTVAIHPPKETMVWVMGSLFVLILFYIIRKLW